MNPLIATVSIRWAGPADEAAIATLAALDSRTRPPGQMLVADAGGEILAAVTADGTQAIADPFRQRWRWYRSWPPERPSCPATGPAPDGRAAGATSASGPSAGWCERHGQA